MADDDTMVVSGQDQQPDAPNVPPAVFGTLAQQQAPDLGQPTQQPTLAPQPVQRPGGGHLPLLGQALSELISPPTRMEAPGPGQIATMRPVSRAADFEGFLGQFFQAMGMGLASEGRGPGAAMRGAAGAMLGPQQYAMQQAQFQQQQQLGQAELAQRQAQAQLTQQQAQFLPTQEAMQQQAATAQPRWDPLTKEFIGTMTDAAYSNYVKGASAAKQNAISKQAAADLAAGKVSKYLPTPDGHYLALDAKGNPLHVVDGAVDPQMMQKYSSTQQLVPDGAGGYLVVPKTTTSGVAMSPQQRMQAQVPQLGANQGPQQQLQNKVPNLANPSGAGGRHIYGQGPVFAFDPQSSQTVMTTPAEAAANGYTNPRKVSEGDIRNEQSASAMISDVQLNKSRYAAAMNQFYQEPVTSKQAVALAALTPEKLGIDIGHGFGLTLPDVIQKVTNAEAFSQLSGTQKKAMIGYYSTLASVPAYQKALSNIGRPNKEVMDLEMRTVPTPLMDRETFGLMLDRFQGNIDQVGRRTVKFPGIDTVQDVRQKYEGQPARTTQPGQSFNQQMGLIQ